MAITDDEGSLDSARRTLGLPEAALRGARIRDVDLYEIRVPLVEGPEKVAAQIVELGVVAVRLGSLRRARRLPWEMRATVVLSRANGVLLEATFERPKAGSLPGPELTVEAARVGLTSHAERYIAISGVAPKVSLVAAMDHIEMSGYASVTEAARIEAVLVEHEWMDHPRRNVWAITLAGLPPWEIHGPPDVPRASVPVWKRNHLRHVIDATTGEVLFATTIPQPRENT